MKLTPHVVVPVAVVALGLTGASAAVAGGTGAAASPTAVSARPPTFPGGFRHLVVIYEENHSFDNLYGGWGSVGGQAVDGTGDPSYAGTPQVAQDGTPYSCLLQTDVNLAAVTPATCHDGHTVYNTGKDDAGTVKSDSFDSAFTNRRFTIDDFIARDDTTCPNLPDTSSTPKGKGAKGGCTRDLVHRFYQEQYQLDGGAQDRYVTGSDATGLTMGQYRTTDLPVYRYLHSAGAPNYVVADRFFQAAFGGSFLNHQWLIAARTPADTSPTTDGVKASGAKNSKVDSNGMVKTYPLYKPTSAVADEALTRRCTDADAGVEPYEAGCGDWAVNTMQPSSVPWNGTGVRLPLLTYPTIGDRLSDAGISWAWYSGGWDDAQTKAGPLFQYHHQPFNYFAAYAPGQPGRAHLQDESKFLDTVASGELPTVSFVKPYGLENEHPGYASEPDGSDHLVELLRAITEGPQAGNTLVVVTYDEFGGQWDHVPPPGQGSATPGPHDVWGPGTRIPALVIGRSLTRSGVDHTSYDTTSILATIEHSFGLEPLSTRDAAVNDLTNAVRVGGRG